MADLVNKKKFTFYDEIPLPEEMKRFVSDAENIMFSVKTFRDSAIFTDKKILICDKQGITGKKVEYFAIPYSKVVTYAIETAGRFDLDAEIKLNLTGGMEVELQFIKSAKMNELLFKVFRLIDDHVIE